MNDSSTESEQPIKIDRRDFVKLAALFAAIGAESRALAQTPADDAPEAITEEAVAGAEKILGLQFSDEERKLMLSSLRRNLANFGELRELEIPNSIPPAIYFDPEAAISKSGQSERPSPDHLAILVRQSSRPSNPESLAYLKASELAYLIREREISPVELTELYLDRLKRLNPKLNCVVNFRESAALAEAEEREREIRDGRYRGPLHGLPWGAKDLFATADLPTTWGAKPFETQQFDHDAEVVKRLRDAGAILIAKLSLGELAMGDQWFRGRTNNPWNLDSGSSGSSAGPAAATAAGCVAFSIGTETLGSIVSPSTACGVTGLRPTFGRVSRAGAMALSWSMDKIGPMCRSAEDCALVFNAIHGADPDDPTSINRPFDWPEQFEISNLKFGFVERDFESAKRNPSLAALHQDALKLLESLGAKMTPITLPDYPLGAIRMILSAEAATAFDDLTRANLDDQLASQAPFSWPNIFRSSRFIPAVEYLRAQRARTMLMLEMAGVMDGIDLFVAPSGTGDTLTLTNLTGHPSVTVPIGFDEGMPRSITFIGKLYDESTPLAVARAYQESTKWHLRHPVLE